MTSERVEPLGLLESRVSAREAIFGVIGLGYVGLPLACTIAERGLTVLGFDVDDSKISRLLRCESYIHHVDPSRLRPIIRVETAGESAPAVGFTPTRSFVALSRCDVILICVPTPLSEGREPDLSFVVGTTETIARHLRPGQLIVLESTTYPGTTDELVRPILEGGGLRVGRDIALAFSPEREDPANPTYRTESIPKLVGGITERCTRLAASAYSRFLERVVPVSSARVAESAKLLENIFRSVNIAFINELKLLFQRMDIDVWEVIEAASSKPFGFMPFYPGPGLGGHCIPVDPFYLTWKARHYDFATRFIELAGEINTAMPYHVVERVTEALNDRGKALRGAEVLILGMAYKRDVDDTRESPSLKLLEILGSRGARVAYNDPYIPSLRQLRFRRYPGLDLDSTELTDEMLGSVDCVLIATDHSAYDWQRIVDRSRLVVDTRNATRNVAGRVGKVVLA